MYIFFRIFIEINISDSIILQKFKNITNKFFARLNFFILFKLKTMNVCEIDGVKGTKGLMNKRCNETFQTKKENS